MKKMLGSLIVGLFMTVSAWAAVDINTATQSELEAVKGIGPAKAKAIVEHRNKNGAFKNLDALAEVKGFGKASVAKLKGELSTGAAKPESRKK